MALHFMALELTQTAHKIDNHLDGTPPPATTDYRRFAGYAHRTRRHLAVDEWMMFSIRPSFGIYCRSPQHLHLVAHFLPVDRNGGGRFYFALQLGYGDRRDPHLSRCADSIVDLTRSEADLADQKIDLRVPRGWLATIRPSFIS